MIEQEQESVLERRLREMLAEDAQEVRPGPAPFPEIVVQGRHERRKQLAVTAAALVGLAALAAVPAVALTVMTDEGGGPARYVAMAPATPTASASVTHGPKLPASANQLVDVTYQQASDWLGECLRYVDEGHVSGDDWPRARLDELRILLAHRVAGDAAADDGHWVVAVKDSAPEMTMMCRIVGGRVAGFAGSHGAPRAAQSPLVVEDANAAKLWRQAVPKGAPWKLPYRWGDFGTVDRSVVKVTVTYGGKTVEAGVEDGRYAASGVIDRKDDRPPRIKGYDSLGTLIYDSAEDPAHPQDAP
ncbi:hypothetical protein [Streptomyces sp. NPDC090022]|uniref:hypothetical protein n=1 Tax=Streptomyces sp. NPDC090022 TaxID=3365920 RepID=UPI0038136CA4